MTAQARIFDKIIEATDDLFDMPNSELTPEQRDKLKKLIDMYDNMHGGIVLLNILGKIAAWLMTVGGGIALLLAYGHGSASK